MKLPGSLLDSLGGSGGFDRESFEEVHRSGEQVTSIRRNPRKSIPVIPGSSPVPWAKQGYYLSTRPSFTFDPQFHAGCYYVQEASSMFLEQALEQTVDITSPLKILDLCAAPGGKSTHIQSLISPQSLLVSNELIRSRVPILRDNIIKWGGGNVLVTQNDPADFSIAENYFDLMLIDAPCSGSGLFRRDPAAIETWSENNIRLCSQRQQRIISDAWPALRKNGILIYSTCSYSREEDEDIIAWLLANFEAEPVPLAIEPGWKIIESGGGYRFWPDKLQGEGLFLAAIRKKDGEETNAFPSGRIPAPLSPKETEIVKSRMNNVGFHLFTHKNTVYAWPEELAPGFAALPGPLHIIYSGILVGELIKDKLIPAHALAMSGLVAGEIEKIELDRDRAIRYLQRREWDAPLPSKGWKLVAYSGQPLGWVNVLTNRVNNYYPKELRIRKESEAG